MVARREVSALGPLLGSEPVTAFVPSPEGVVLVSGGELCVGFGSECSFEVLALKFWPHEEREDMVFAPAKDAWLSFCGEICASFCSEFGFVRDVDEEDDD